jgi:hypothetical protein
VVDVPCAEPPGDHLDDSALLALARSGDQRALEATRNAGHTWTLAPAASTSQAGNTPGSASPAATTSDGGLLPGNVVYLSCPVRAGCVALANDGSGNQSSWTVLSNLTPQEGS